MTWFTFEQPSAQNLKHYGTDFETYLKHANLLAPIFIQKFSETLVGPLSDKKILEFGVGIGRVALKMWVDHGLPSHGCDVNEYSIEYMRRQVPEMDLRHTNFEPPLPYDDEMFDGLYALSVWTHLPPKLQLPWLEEMYRILKPGGVALITTVGPSGLALRKERLPTWKDVSEDDIKSLGQVFVEYPGLKKNPDGFPGIGDSYGTVLHSHEHVREVWGKVFPHVEICPQAILNGQDMIVLRK